MLEERVRPTYLIWVPKALIVKDSQPLGQLMTPHPKALGLTFCYRVINDERTQMRSLVDMFQGKSVMHFPTPPQDFYTHAALLGGLGNGTIKLTAIQESTGNQIYAQQQQISFRTQREIVAPYFHIRSIVFPAIGQYLFQLFLDDKAIDNAQRYLTVYPYEPAPVQTT